MMRKSGIMMLFVTMVASAMGQGLLPELPCFPRRNNENIKVIRSFSVDTLTGARELVHTELYDRHGYSTDSAYRNVYDNRGRLVLHETYSWVSTSANPMPHREVSSRCSIEYAADGFVQHAKTERFSKYNEGVEEYNLLSHKVHPRFGYTECVYLSGNDTLRFLREYASDGRLLHEYCDDGGTGYRDCVFYYDASGRIVASRTYYNEAWDTLDYLYDANGFLISQMGKLYNLDMEADVAITFRPDGTRKERRDHWVSYEDPSDTSDEYCRYDEHDVLVCEKGPWGVTEYEIEYWEDGDIGK